MAVGLGGTETSVYMVDRMSALVGFLLPLLFLLDLQSACCLLLRGGPSHSLVNSLWNALTYTPGGMIANLLNIFLSNQLDNQD